MAISPLDTETNQKPEFPANSISKYQEGLSSYVEGLFPEASQQISLYEMLEILSKRYGFEAIQNSFRPDYSQISPRLEQQNGDWLKNTRMVGINVRTVGSFINVVKYALTLPSFHDSIHLLPIWEPGVVGSLYGLASWHINPEFFSKEVQVVFPAMDTPEKQLRASINLLHLMGFSVGMDVIPHTDRFSEMVAAYPRFFEWVQQIDGEILDHSEEIWRNVEAEVYSFLELNGTADGSGLPSFEYLFGEKIDLWKEEERMRMLFGEKGDYAGRQERRIALLRFMTTRGFETLPMTMAPPYRSLHINKEVYIKDEDGYRWYQYEFDTPQTMSRVFGPLTRYRLFHSKDDNKNWELDFERPIPETWEYVQKNYMKCQKDFGFDFMRGDMTHVQMRPEGVPGAIPEYYDLLASVKSKIIKNNTPYFAFFAESFIGAPDFMGYGDEITHLEAIASEVTLGDLQSTVVGSELFMTRFRQYLDVAATRNLSPCFTTLTADKDDPRFDEFYRTGNLVRYFIALFMTDLPSYTAAGFEVRNRHLERGENEEYSKLYVFQIFDENETDKVTGGPYRWGQNFSQFQNITELRQLGEKLIPELNGKDLYWLSHPDPTLSKYYIAWQLNDYVFVCNLNGNDITKHVSVPQKNTNGTLRLIYSTEGKKDESSIGNGLFYVFLPLEPCECRIYKFE